MDLDEVADRLYALPPPEFTAARDAEVRAARDAGQAALARDIAKLRKPTVSAWAVNRVARERPRELDELLDLGERLRAAWAEQDADALAELTQRRASVTDKVARLIRAAGELSPAAGAEVDQTLDAAVVDADAAAQVRRGRLAKALNYSGFAPAPAPASAGGRRAGRKKPTPEDEAAQAKAREAAEARKARERAEAEAAHREWAEALRVASEEHDERAERVARLEKKLAKARKKLADAEQRLEVTRREERHARHRLGD
ncbi:hypothetical protein HII36_30170 [Nonomuraea sp. NN258]|uniref:hypothetical protein n=1 Tax=Nonomuraea antri TaxID=2730852 RepID=UPI001568B9FD|nr:hypothetical protein [Nonomuraea antri]NRQ36068.1 hypothetical protein [Nonomuraea antri]